MASSLPLLAHSKQLVRINCYFRVVVVFIKIRLEPTPPGSSQHLAQRPSSLCVNFFSIKHSPPPPETPHPSSRPLYETALLYKESL